LPGGSEYDNRSSNQDSSSRYLDYEVGVSVSPKFDANEIKRSHSMCVPTMKWNSIAPSGHFTLNKLNMAVVLLNCK